VQEFPKAGSQIHLVGLVTQGGAARIDQQQPRTGAVGQGLLADRTDKRSYRRCLRGKLAGIRRSEAAVMGAMSRTGGQIGAGGNPRSTVIATGSVQESVVSGNHPRRGGLPLAGGDAAAQISGGLSRTDLESAEARGAMPQRLGSLGAPGGSRSSGSPTDPRCWR
jgi:hypothetical protein